MRATAAATNRVRNLIEVFDRQKDLREIAEADQLIAALGDAFPTRTTRSERRKEPRLRYQVRARLELVDESGETVDSTSLHTRDVSPQATGFVTPSNFADDARGVLHLPSADGTGAPTKVPCRVRRTREAGNGWFEGVVEFDDRESVFSSKKIARK